MDQKKESPRFILILGSLFLLAYAAYNLGTAWMDSVPGNSKAQIGLVSTPTPTSLPAKTTPTNVPLRWITPTSSSNETFSVLEGTPYPANDSSNPEDIEAYPPPSDAYPASPEQVPTNVPSPTPTLASTTANIPPTATPTSITPTATPTSDSAYPGPEETDNPYPGPQETQTPTSTSTNGDAYPGPGETSSPTITSTPVATETAGPPTPTLTPTQPNSTPVETAASQTPFPPTGTPPPIITTLTYTETQIIANGLVNQAIWLDDDSLALATSNGVYLHDLSLGRSKILDARYPISSITSIPDDEWIAAGGQDSVIRLWDITDSSFMTSLNGHLLGVIRLAYSQPVDLLFSASDDATVRVWDYDGTPLHTFRNSVTRVTDMDVSLNGQMVVASSNRHVHIWDPASGELSKTISQPDGWYTAAAFRPDSLILSTAFDGRRLEFWDTVTWERTDFVSLNANVLSLAYSPNGRMLAISFDDDSIKILDAGSLFVLADFAGHSNLTSMEFSLASDQLLTSSADGSIRIWDVSPVLNP